MEKKKNKDKFKKRNQDINNKLSLDCGNGEMNLHDKMTQNYMHTLYGCQIPGFDIVR